jgi:hypothetical protein
MPRVVMSHPQRIRRWAVLITLGVWLVTLCVALLLARTRDVPPRESQGPQFRQPLLSEPPPLPRHIRHPVA